ncbi:MAG: hypothetical protein AAF368_15705, partial [Planctomycetota bacterium]
WAFVVCALPSCSSTGSRKAGPPTIISLIQPLQGQRLELVNATHTDPVELYSQTRERANRKVATDEILEALIEKFNNEEFQTYSAPGGVPEGAMDERGTAIVVDVAGERRAIWGNLRTPERKLLALNKCIAAFIQVYSNIYALQKKDLRAGEDPFAPQVGSR